MKNTISRMNSSVGPKPRITLAKSDGPVFGFVASMMTCLDSSVAESCWLLANDGTWVAKLVAGVTDLSLAG